MSFLVKLSENLTFQSSIKNRMCYVMFSSNVLSDLIVIKKYIILCENEFKPVSLFSFMWFPLVLSAKISKVKYVVINYFICPLKMKKDLSQMIKSGL